MQGQYWDSETDLCYNRYRYFDPQTCSFISQDPLGLAAGEMESVIFQLHSDWLENPDADLRYLIAEELEKLSNDELKIVEDGYEYDDDLAILCY